MKHIFILLLIICTSGGYAQKRLEASPIDNWPREAKVPISLAYNRVSSYLYVLNSQKYLDLFQGVKYSEKDRKLLNIKKNDKPDYLQMSIVIKHTKIANNETIDIPLLLFNISDESAKNTFNNYEGGVLLKNISVNELDSDVMGVIKVNALISNATEKFWKDILKISADLGKSATSIALGDPKGVTELTTKITEYLNLGLKAIDDLSNEPKTKTENYNFFVKLIEKPNDPAFEEIVTSAILYEVHWSGIDPMQGQDNFSNLKGKAGTSELNSKDFKSAINSNNLPLVLIVETRSKPIIDVGKPVFSDDYRNEIAKESSNSSEEDKGMIKNYSTNFNSAYNASNYIRNFNLTVNSNNIDWNSLIYAIDYTYQFKISMKAENQKYLSTNYTDNYRVRYETIKLRYKILDDFVNKLYEDPNNDYLKRADSIIKELVNPIKTNLTEVDQYNKVKIFYNYDNIINNSNADKSSLKSSMSYQKAVLMRGEYEKALYNKIAEKMPSSDSERIIFYEKIKIDYDLCNECVTKSSMQINSIQKSTHEILVNELRNLKISQNKEFDECRRLIENEMPSIRSKIESIKNTFDKKIGNDRLLQLENNLRIWRDNVWQDSSNPTNEQISLWSVAILESRKKIKEAYTDLKFIKVLPNSVSCLEL